MALLLPLGLAIALNAAVLGTGSVWLRPQARRFAAEDKASYRGMFVLKPLSPAGDKVQILVVDDDGLTPEVAAVHWPSLGWTDARTLLWAPC